MKIKDATKMENIHALTTALETRGKDFCTEDKLLSDILGQIRELAVAAGVKFSNDKEKPDQYTIIENDIDDLLNMLGINYYVRGMKTGARLLGLLFEEPEDPEA